MIDAADFLKWLQVYGITSGGGGGGVTSKQVQEFAFNFEPAAGVDDAFIVNLSPAVTLLTDGLIVTMSSGTLQNLTNSPTLQVNSLTPVSIVLWDGALAPGDIETHSSYIFIYNSNANTFQLINPSLTTANTFLTQKNFYNIAIDAGTANSYIVTLNPKPIGSFGLGFPIYMQVGASNTNTGASTITVNGTTNNITLRDGSALPSGALIGNQIAYMLFDNNLGNWVLMNPVLPIAGIPTTLITTITYSAAINNKYIVNSISGLSSITLPATCTIGDEIFIQGYSVDGWSVIANTGQTISGGSSISSSGGSVSSQSGIDNISLMCVANNTEWRVINTYSAGLTYI